MSRFTNVLAAAVVAGGMGLATDANGQSGGCNGGNCPPGPTTQNPGTVINNNLSATGGAATATTGPVTATGGTAQAIGGAGGQGGQGGSSSVANNQTIRFERQLPMGIVGGASPPSGGLCPEGWSAFASVPFVGAGGGRTTQNQTCITDNRLLGLLNNRDPGVVGMGITEYLREYPEALPGAVHVRRNLGQSCGPRAAGISAMFLAVGELDCSQIPGVSRVVEAPTQRPQRRPTAPTAAPAQGSICGITVNIVTGAATEVNRCPMTPSSPRPQ